MQKHLFSVLLLSVLLLPVASQANQQVVAKVVALRNSATATSLDGAIRKLASKAPILEGDTIQTGKRGRIQIIFTDNTIISLGRNANLSIHEYLWQPELEKGALRTEVKEGIFRIMGGAITKTNPENFTTKTPAATIGIRGSMYAGRVSGNSLSVVFQGGRGIFVQNEHGRVEIPTPGHGTNVRGDQAPPPAVRFTPQEIDALAPSEAPPENTEPEDGDGPDEEGVPYLEDSPEPNPIPSVDDPVIDLPPPNIYTLPELVLTPWVPPTTGVSHFTGSLTGTLIEGGISEPLDESMEVFANWHNSTIIGNSIDPNFPSMPVIFFGKISGTTVSTITFFGGTGGDMMTIDTVEGTGTGSFGGYGTSGLFDISGSGSDYAIEPLSQPVIGTWSATGQAQLDITKPSLSGTSTWKGYSIGLAENMADINTNRHLPRNADHDDFTMTINRDTGTISGSLNATDGTFSTNLSIGGGTTNSAYVHEHLLGAFLNGTVSYGGTESLKPHGNYLLSGDMDQQNVEYATWGYWEIAYQNPGTSEQYHNHVPGALWIAGEPTSSTDLAALASGIVTGYYNGEVRGSRISSVGNVSEVGGSFQIDVNFADAISGAASGFSGTMNIDGLATFDVHSVAGPQTGAGRFTDGLMDNYDAFTGQLSGTLYGPNAISIGGNFTTTDGADVYQGIYGGNR